MATTTFILALSQIVRTNDFGDKDGLKHAIRPPVVEGSRGKVQVIYVTGSTPDVIASLKRRGMLAEQCGKLGAPLGAISFGGVQMRCFAAAKARQERNWLSLPDEQVLRIEYDQLWDKISEIEHFLDIPSNSLRAIMPERRNRSSKATEC